MSAPAEAVSVFGPCSERGRTCPACADARCRAAGRKNRYTLYLCRRCGVTFTHEREEAEALHELYDHYYDRAGFEPPAFVVASLERVAASVTPFRRTSRWLDIGYGEGALLDVAERRGWTCYGTEIAPQALRYGERRGWVVSARPDNNPRFPLEGFDVVTMIEVLEHVPDPDSFLRAAARWLRPGGVLYLTTPNGNSLNRRLLGLCWSVFSPPEHLTIWTARGLRWALASAGLLTYRIRTEGLNPSEVLRRLRPAERGKAPVSRNEAGLELIRVFSHTPLRRRMKDGINQCLSVLGVGDSLKVWARRGRTPSGDG